MPEKDQSHSFGKNINTGQTGFYLFKPGFKLSLIIFGLLPEFNHRGYRSRGGDINGDG